MTRDHKFIKWAVKNNACTFGVDYAMKFKSPETFWRRCERSSYLVWVLLHCPATRSRFKKLFSHEKAAVCRGCQAENDIRILRKAFPVNPWTERTR